MDPNLISGPDILCLDLCSGSGDPPASREHDHITSAATTPLAERRDTHQTRVHAAARPTPRTRYGASRAVKSSANSTVGNVERIFCWC
jgi:hypothetical protein